LGCAVGTANPVATCLANVPSGYRRGSIHSSRIST